MANDSTRFIGVSRRLIRLSGLRRAVRSVYMRDVQLSSLTLYYYCFAAPADGKLSVSRPDDADGKSDGENSELETWDHDVDDELKFRCSSALSDRTPPIANSAEISTCDGDIFDESLHLSAEKVRDVATSADVETEKDLHAVSDDVVSQSGQEDGGCESVSSAVGDNCSSNVDHVDKEGSRSESFPQSEPEADSRANFGKRVTSERRCSRRREKVYGAGSKRRRGSPHPSSVYKLGLPPPQPKPSALWQPWTDNRGSSATLEHGSSLQMALENLRCLSGLSSAAGHHDASAASVVTTAATGNVTSVVNRMTSSAQAIGSSTN